MSVEITTLQGLLGSLPDDPKAPLVFVTDEGEIAPGYHITEVRVASIDAIDCGRGQSRWKESQLQLLDGSKTASEFMSIGKFRQIAQASSRALPDLGGSTLVVEYAPGNAAFSRYSPVSVESRQGRIYIGLTAHHAVCKPAVRMTEIAGEVGTLASSKCCGGNPRSQADTTTACCG